ncbi:DcaP family trimeric outer membrane transporter [Halomonas piscis]|uniref:DcaP family trimeric outer membrane transporter n=1 Tax=Halomonas piscis TaxID=3031727 RepID=A0ABY9Z1V2_9GAMM|nr:DcaP family trimeric outer membrane transporter [Halomonas piscis]WNK20813.1 DcaP family trimeric outer membrane transporter [Halomonas piscis]
MKPQHTLKLAIQTAAAAAALGIAGQASAVDLNVTDDAEVSLYGFARLNMSYDFDGDNAVSTRAGTFDMDNDDKGHFGADAYQSRLGVKVKHATGVDLTVEGGFRGGDGGDFRLRHAFGEYRGFLAGRTWSNYNSFVGATPTLDFDSLAGLAGLQDRTEQLRYTTGPLSFSVEDTVRGPDIASGSTPRPGSNELDRKDVANFADTRQSAPALTARVEDSAGAVSYSAAGLVNRVSADDAASDDSAIGYGVFGATTIDLNDMIAVHGAVNFTDGANDYLYRSGNNFYGTSAYVDGSDIETVKGYGGSLGTSLDLGQGRSINLGYGMTKLDLDDAVDAGAMTNEAAEKNQNAMLNYQWTPVTNVMMGVEYGYYHQETKGGNTSEANRVLFATQYDF